MDQEQKAEREKNMLLWDRICKSDPWQLKKVEQRGGYITIDAHSQVKKITEVFGTIGEGWKFETEIVDSPDAFFIVKVSVFRKLESGEWAEPVTQFGCDKWGTGQTAKDTPKKAVTDGLTKCFSYWGFNADVFMGEWDDKDLPAAQSKAAPTLGSADAEKFKELMKSFNDHVEQVDEETAKKAQKFVTDNNTIAGVEKAIAKLKASLEAK